MLRSKSMCIGIDVASDDEGGCLLHAEYRQLKIDHVSHFITCLLTTSTVVEVWNI